MSTVGIVIKMLGHIIEMLKAVCICYYIKQLNMDLPSSSRRFCSAKV